MCYLHLLFAFCSLLLPFLANKNIYKLVTNRHKVVINCNKILAIANRSRVSAHTIRRGHLCCNFVTLKSR